MLLDARVLEEICNDVGPACCTHTSSCIVFEACLRHARRLVVSANVKIGPTNPRKLDSTAKTPRSRPSPKQPLPTVAQTSRHGTPNRHQWSSPATTPATYLRSIDSRPLARNGRATMTRALKCPRPSLRPSTMILQTTWDKYRLASRRAVV